MIRYLTFDGLYKVMDDQTPYDHARFVVGSTTPDQVVNAAAVVGASHVTMRALRVLAGVRDPALGEIRPTNPREMIPMELVRAWRALCLAYSPHADAFFLHFSKQDDSLYW